MHMLGSVYGKYKNVRSKVSGAVYSGDNIFAGLIWQ